ncbi:hypothetical protein P12x_001348 [Tundrisphaera lichenicola]|uniref:hypothetical protein n=1 Tax=Tundrisphaera lichenicola TaxID=2029860 RepID=UPI003EBA2E5E
MRIETLYVILDRNGKSRVVRDQTTDSISLNELLADGWRPTRETPFGGSGIEILILLEREAEGSFGFGFRPS